MQENKRDGKQFGICTSIDLGNLCISFDKGCD